MVTTILVALGSSFYFVIMLHSVVDFVMAFVTAIVFAVVFTNLRAALDPVVGGPFSTSTSAVGGGGGRGRSSPFGQRRRIASASITSPSRG